VAVPPVNFTHEVITLAVGAVAGGLGALLGIGGGVILIPFLNLALGLTFNQATGISLITIIATSSAASAAKGRLQLVNLRLGMVLEVFTTSGGVLGLWLFGKTDSHTVRMAFAATLLGIALIVLSRIDKRNVLEPGADIGALGGRFHDKETGGLVAYRVKRAPLAFGMSLLAGIVSNFGIGGGILKVPVLNSWCGVPIRAAAATSSLMLGATAFVVAADRFRHGQIIPELAAAAVLGVLAGTQVGVWAQRRFHPKTHKLVMVGLLLAVSALYFSGVGKR
jgi:uncharacterized membrane protein YfcA